MQPSLSAVWFNDCLVFPHTVTPLSSNLDRIRKGGASAPRYSGVREGGGNSRQNAIIMLKCVLSSSLVTTHNGEKRENFGFLFNFFSS